MNLQRLDRVALFAALSLFLSIIELVIPKPIPFFRIGLANLPLLIALTLFTRREFVLLVLLKVFGQGIVSGTLFSYVFLFSATGSFSSGAVMLLLRRWYPKRISLVGIGVVGAFASNSAQLLFASLYIFGRSTWLIAPLFLLIGTLSGIILGATAGYLLQHSRWLVRMPSEKSADESSQPTQPPKHEIYKEQMDTPAARITPVVRLVSGLLMIAPFIMQPQILLKFVHILLFGLASIYLGKGVRILPGIMIAAAVTGAQLLTPLGEVLTYIGSFPITAGALRQGLLRGLNLVGLVYVSRYAVSPGLPIPGKMGALLYKVFYYFEELTAYRVVRDRSTGFWGNIKQALIGIDGYLLQLSLSPADAAEGRAHKRAMPAFGVHIAVPIVWVGLNWILYAVGYAYL
ncbi:MAG: Gx transporter family protein [Spirochaetaceae bacterium]|nr:Gx transporter family protein [Spirochaetaceae bacterium]MCF7949372.1 Gx transporter family protein [Spirochaetia bacterium]MCF7951481.1 Gx transporter family protein [Spirochaetaceae bacterium]